MERTIAKRLQYCDEGKMTRRQLIQGLALTAATATTVALVPAAAAAGPSLKAVGIKNISFDVHDYRKIRDFYVDLLGTRVFDDTNGKHCHIQIGDTYFTPYTWFAGTPRPRVQDFALGLRDFDKRLVNAAMESRGIKVTWGDDDSPEAGTAKIQDPEGFTLQLVPHTQDLALTAKAASAAASSATAVGTRLKALGIHHIALDVQDYTKLRDFYADLFGMEVSQGPDKSVCRVGCGDMFFSLRNPTHKKEMPPTPFVDHIAISVEPWENQNDSTITGAPTLAAELKRRGLELVPDTTEVMINDPEGFTVQLTEKDYKTPNYKILNAK